MLTRRFALVWGILFLLVGLAGFVPGLLTPPDEAIAVDAMHGHLFGLFPVNLLHDLVHLAFGVWGIVVWRTFAADRGYAKAVAVIYALLANMGFIPVLRTTFGLVPLYGHDIWLHLLLAIPAAYFGFRPVRQRPVAAGTVPPATGGAPRTDTPGRRPEDRP